MKYVSVLFITTLAIFTCNLNMLSRKRKHESSFHMNEMYAQRKSVTSAESNTPYIVLSVIKG